MDASCQIPSLLCKEGICIYHTSVSKNQFTTKIQTTWYCTPNPGSVKL